MEILRKNTPSPPNTRVLACFWAPSCTTVIVLWSTSFLAVKNPSFEVCVGDELHLNRCISYFPQAAHFAVHNGYLGALSRNLGASDCGFQQLSTRYGVLLLDAPITISVQLLQLARRNLRPKAGSQRFGCERTVRVNQPPLAIAPPGSEVGKACADELVPWESKTQRVCDDAVLGEASRQKVIGSPVIDGTEMTSNSNPFVEGSLPKGLLETVSASKSTDGVTAVLFARSSSCLN